MPGILLENHSRASWRQYLELCKPNVVLLIAFTAIVGMVLATDTLAVNWIAVVFGTLGIGLGAASGAAINHVVDQKIDAVMDRTKNRPLPTGGLSSESALVFALILAVLSMVILVSLVNVLTAVLTLLSMVGYAVIYTMYLKRATPHNIVLGGAAGAAPPVLGWAAVTGEVTVEAMVLFLIIFIWTPPHIWALAIKRRDDYAAAGLPMLPVTHGIEFTKQQVLLYTFMLLSVSLLPFTIHMSGLLYLFSAVLLGLGFIYHAFKLYRQAGDEHAMKTFGFSIVYLMALFAALLIDHFIAIGMSSVS
ncbi:MAG: protoheme IX farnesyltransferase [Pseudomonadales bacterium]|nr:protoheme IX farnesyltransferase [Pseudomonadales bacterium]